MLCEVLQGTTVSYIEVLYGRLEHELVFDSIVGYGVRLEYTRIYYNLVQHSMIAGSIIISNII